MKSELTDHVRLGHIYECIVEIETALHGKNFETFSEDHVLRIAVVKWLEIIGEAANHITDETKDKFSNVEWRKMVGLRNTVVHEYFGVNYEIIWLAATTLLKNLKEQISIITLS